MGQRDSTPTTSPATENPSDDAGYSLAGGEEEPSHRPTTTLTTTQRDSTSSSRHRDSPLSSPDPILFACSSTPLSARYHNPSLILGLDATGALCTPHADDSVLTKSNKSYSISLGALKRISEDLLISTARNGPTSMCDGGLVLYSRRLNRLLLPHDGFADSGKDRGRLWRARKPTALEFVPSEREGIGGTAVVGTTLAKLHKRPPFPSLWLVRIRDEPVFVDGSLEEEVVHCSWGQYGKVFHPVRREDVQCSCCELSRMTLDPPGKSRRKRVSRMRHAKLGVIELCSCADGHSVFASLEGALYKVDLEKQSQLDFSSTLVDERQAEEEEEVPTRTPNSMAFDREKALLLTLFPDCEDAGHQVTVIDSRTPLAVGHFALSIGDESSVVLPEKLLIRNLCVSPSSKCLIACRGGPSSTGNNSRLLLFDLRMFQKISECGGGSETGPHQRLIRETGQLQLPLNHDTTREEALCDFIEVDAESVAVLASVGRGEKNIELWKPEKSFQDGPEWIKKTGGKALCSADDSVWLCGGGGLVGDGEDLEERVAFLVQKQKMLLMLSDDDRRGGHHLFCSRGAEVLGDQGEMIVFVPSWSNAW